MIIPSEVRWQQYVVAKELVILGETSLYNRYRQPDLERISRALKIPKSSLIKVSHRLGKKGKTGTKFVMVSALIIWAKAVVRRDSQFFTCKPIWIE